MSNAMNSNIVLCFAMEMQNKLDMNTHKSHWKKSSIGYLTGRLHDEVGELKRAIKKNEDGGDIIQECADIANFAMMIADSYEQL